MMMACQITCHKYNPCVEQQLVVMWPLADTSAFSAASSHCETKGLTCFKIVTTRTCYVEIGTQGLFCQKPMPQESLV